MLAFASRGCEHPLASIPNRPGYPESLVHSSLFAAVRQNRRYAHPRSPGKSDSANRLGRECAPTSTAIAEGHREPSQLAMPSLQHTSFANPSKLPFRAYLTEQPFRRHPAHLDDPSDQDLDLPGVHYSSHRNTISHPDADSARSQVHFVNWAFVILHTPLDAYRNLLFFTVAFIVPPVQSDAKPSDPDFTASNVWLVGAFGGWWRGGSL